MSEELRPRAYILADDPSGVRVCAAAARISTTPGGARELFAAPGSRQRDEALIEKVLSSGHDSLIEHMHISLAFDNVSMAAEHFITDFRLASFMVKSRRYVSFGKAGYFVPEFLKMGGNEDCLARYTAHMDGLFREYGYFLENGVSMEDARFVLPLSLLSSFYCTVNGRVLLHMLGDMLYGRGAGRGELLELAGQIIARLEELYPFLHRAALSMRERRGERVIYEERPVSGAAVECGARARLIDYTKNYDGLIAAFCSFESSLEDFEKAPLGHGEMKRAVNAPRARYLEQGCFLFALENVSLSGLTHIERHRMQSLMSPEISSAAASGKYMIPPSISESPALKERYVRAVESTLALYRSLKERFPGEELDYIALCGYCVTAVTTMNGRELLHFLKLRTCARAQWEVRGLANQMLERLRDVYPDIFRHFGPSCYVTGRCPEGRLSCGRQNEMKRLYGQGDG